MPAERVAAIDVGGTSLKGAVAGCGPAGSSPEVVQRPAPVADGPQAVVEAVLGFVAELASPEPGVVGVGVAVPGIVDEAAGTVIEAPNLDWRDVPIGAAVQGRVGLPVTVCHDVRAAALAEGSVGAAIGCEDFLLLTLGTGVGAAVVLGGRAYTGREGRGGELGHTTVDPEGPMCACGRRGCLEAFSSATALVRRYAERSGETVDADEVVARALEGDRAAEVVWDDALDALALAVANYVTLLTPERVVIGGGLAGAGDALFSPLARRLDALVRFADPPAIVPAALGSDAGWRGAAIAACQAVGVPRAAFSSSSARP